MGRYSEAKAAFLQVVQRESSHLLAWAGLWRAAIAECELAQDYVSRDILQVQLEDTESDHAYFLEKQLRLIELVGLQNYLQSQIGSEPADAA